MPMFSGFKPSVVPPETQTAGSLWFIYSGYRLLVAGSDRVSVPTSDALDSLGVSIGRSIFLGYYGERSCFAAEGTMREEAPAGVRFQELRSLFELLDAGFYEIALLGIHLLQWEKNCQYCSKCRGLLKNRDDMRAKECANCSRLEFPRLSPAIIVLVEKEDTLLLARSTRFPGSFFSVLAGFVEPGESLEEAVYREVEEETGIRVKDVAYFGSQPWPFPDSLMIGFTARYDSGKIRVDGEEIAEAGWYRAESLPEIPGKLSIARQLIDWFVKRHSQPMQQSPAGGPVFDQDGKLL
jgi:NAD+ diphosphatase